MNCRIMSLAIAALLMVCAAAPMCIQGLDSEENESDSEKLYVISVPGTNAPEQPIKITLANGQKVTWSVYIINTSKKYLDVTFNAYEKRTELSVSIPDNIMLGPDGDVSHSHILAGTISIAADSLCLSESGIEIPVTIGITDITDRKSTVFESIKFIVDIDSSYSSNAEYNKFFGVFENNLPEPLNSPIVTMLVTMALWTVIIYVACTLVIPIILRKFTHETQKGELEGLNKTLTNLITLAALIMVIVQSAGIIGAGPEVINTARFIGTIVNIMLICVVIWKLYRFLIMSILEHMDDADSAGVDATLFPLFSMLGKLILWVGGTSAVLGCFGVNLQGILVSAGVISLGITLGAQNVLSQFFSGIVLLSTRPFRTGDFLKINGNVYIVRKVKLMFTEFYGWDKDMIITMPNNTVTSATIVNLTKEDRAYRLFTFFSVGYDVDLKKVDEIMVSVANKSRFLVSDARHSPPSTKLTKFEDSSLEIRLAMYIDDFDHSSVAEGEIRRDVYQALVDNNINIPYEKLDIVVVNNTPENSSDKKASDKKE